MKLSVIGLGKLGACAAACFAYKGFETLGVDVNAAFVDAINAGEAPVVEPRLQELITASRARLRATMKYEEAIAESDITFLIVPTPSEEDGHFSDKFLRQALQLLAEAYRRLNGRDHTFVITSTVSPGTTESSLIPLIESVSGKVLNRDFAVCYNPEFIALGSVINDSLRPDVILIGESNPDAGTKLAHIYSQVCENGPHLARMSIISSEIAKISLNSFVTMKISYANTLARLCERIPGADVDAITSALGADRRVSPHVLRGGLSFGGPCFPRDNRAFVAFASKFGGDAPLAEATDRINRANTQAILERVFSAVDRDATVAVLGLSYKPNTPVIEESPAIQMVQGLLDRNLRVTVYDPLAMEGARQVFGARVVYAKSVQECLLHAQVCLVPTPWPEFRQVEDLAHNPMTVIDCWRFLDPARLARGVKYIAIGRPAQRT